MTAIPGLPGSMNAGNSTWPAASNFSISLPLINSSITSLSQHPSARMAKPTSVPVTSVPITASQASLPVVAHTTYGTRIYIVF